MTSVPPPSENRWPSERPTASNPNTTDHDRPSFSKAAIAGLVVSCAGLFVFAMAGPIGTALAGVGLRHVRERGLRGRRLAIAGIIIGVVDFAFYVIAVVFLRP